MAAARWIPGRRLALTPVEPMNNSRTFPATNAGEILAMSKQGVYQSVLRMACAGMHN